MAFGTFFVTIDANIIAGTKVESAVITVTSTPKTIRDPEGDVVYLSKSANQNGSSALQAVLELPSDVTTGTSTIIGHTVTVRATGAEPYTVAFAARPIGTTVSLADLPNDLVAPDPSDLTDASLAARASDPSSQFSQAVTSGMASSYRRGLSVTAPAYGAKGDGTTDDTAAIQACIDAAAALGLRVFVPATAAHYKITASLILKTGTTIEGEGYGSHIKQYGTGVYSAFYGTRINRVAVRKLRINGNRSVRQSGLPAEAGDGGSNGIRVDAPDATPATGVAVEDCWIENVSHVGVMVFNYQYVNIARNVITDTRRDGIDVWFNSRYATISDNIVTQAGDDCISLCGENPGHASGAKVRNVTISGGTYSHRSDAVNGRGIWLGGVADVTITGVTVTDTFSHGIHVDQSYTTSYAPENVVISNAVVRNAGIYGGSTVAGSGINIRRGEVEVTGCRVVNSYNNNILVQADASRTTILGGSIDGGQVATTVGVYVSFGATGVLVNGVQVNNTPDVGILLAGHENTVSGCHLYGCSASQTARSYIRIDTGISRCRVFGNMITKTVGAGLYGIRLAGGASTANVVQGNVNISRISAFTAGNFVNDASTGANKIKDNTDDVAAFRCASVDPILARSSDVAGVGAANQALYYRVTHGGTFSKVGLEVTTSSGNISVGFYANNGLGGDAAAPGAQIGTSGAVACPAVGYADVALTGTVTVPDGAWIAVSADNVTAAFRSLLTAEVVSALGKGRAFKQGTAHPLPATTGTLTAITGRNVVLVGTP